MSLTDNYNSRKGEPEPGDNTLDEINWQARTIAEELGIAREALSDLAGYLSNPLPEGDRQAWAEVRHDVLAAIGAVHGADRSRELIRGLSAGEVRFVRGESA